MHFTSSAIAAALFVRLATTTPIDVEKRDVGVDIGKLTNKKTIAIQQVYAGRKIQLPPAQVVLNTYAKFGKLNAAPQKVQSAAKAAQQTGSVAAYPQAYDMSYLSPVTIGGQTLNLNFDTGSSDLWVYSSLQPSSQTAGHVIYDPTLSSTSSLMNGSSWSITYGDGSGASGKVYADTVAIGGVTATAQAVEAATSVSTQFQQDLNSNGLVGLAFNNLNTIRPTPQNTFFESVKSSLVAPLFTAKLVKGGPGSYDFGFINTTKYTGSIVYAPVQYTSGFWQFVVGGFKIQGLPRISGNMGNAIADTGTSLLYLPANVVAAYWAAVPGSSNSAQFGGYIFPCNAALPNFNLGVRSSFFQMMTYYTVPGSYMNYAPISSSMCFGGMQPNTGIGFSILGDIFLKAVFVVFDYSQSVPRIGFAKQA